VPSVRVREVRQPAGDTGLQTLGIAFLCRLVDHTPVRISEESSEHAWFAPEDLPKLAFADVQQAAEAWRGAESFF
jgi:NAD+ diphosphatase